MNIEDVVLENGWHKPGNRFAIMELVAHVNGEPWSNAPRCSPAPVTVFLRAWNCWCTDTIRQRLKEVVPHFAGCNASHKLDDQRLYAFLDLCLRQHCGAWLRLLGHEVSITEVVDEASYDVARRTVGSVMNHIRVSSTMDRYYRDLGRDLHHDTGAGAFFHMDAFRVCRRMSAYTNYILRLVRLATYEGHDPMPTCNQLVTTNLEYVRRMLQLGR